MGHRYIAKVADAALGTNLTFICQHLEFGIWKVMHIHPYNFTQWSEKKIEVSV